MLDIIAAHRKALAEALAQLTPEQWRGPSLCAGWTPAHVLAHQTMPFRIAEREFMTGLQRCGGDFTAFSDQIAERDSALDPAELVAVLRDNAENPWRPPGGGLDGALSHDVIHGLDMTWIADVRYDIPPAAMAAVLTSITAPLPASQHDAMARDVRAASMDETLFGFPLAGLRVSATDVIWSAGEGAALSGASRDLLPLLAGRPIPQDRLTGDGTEHARTGATR